MSIADKCLAGAIIRTGDQQAREGDAKELLLREYAMKTESRNKRTQEITINTTMWISEVVKPHSTYTHSRRSQDIPLCISACRGE
jgi:hypothetical protein